MNQLYCPSVGTTPVILGITTDPIEVIGVWDTNFGMESQITHETWDGSGIVDHDNDVVRTSAVKQY